MQHILTQYKSSSTILSINNHPAHSKIQIRCNNSNSMNKGSSSMPSDSTLSTHHSQSRPRKVYLSYLRLYPHQKLIQ